jgi:hypothetical protein
LSYYFINFITLNKNTESLKATEKLEKKTVPKQATAEFRVNGKKTKN